MKTPSFLQAHELINEAQFIAEFLQTIAIVKSTDDAVRFDGNQISGLYYVMQDMIDRLQKADTLLSEGGEAKS